MPLNPKKKKQKQLSKNVEQENDNNPETEETLEDLAKQGYRMS